MHGDQIPHPLEDCDYQFPSPQEGKGVKCPMGGGGGGLLKLRFDRSITRVVLSFATIFLWKSSSNI